MPQVHYPFIDIAVHPAVRTHFAAGDAVVLFSRDMKDVLWANGEGARLFGHREIYDLIESGPERSGVAFRQLAAAAAQLAVPGDKRGFVMRIASGFQSAAVQATVDLIVVGRDSAVMFSAASAKGAAGFSALLAGFDDDDTHMAVLGAEGEVLAASPGFAHIGVLQDTAQALIAAATRSSEGLVKRPIPSGSGYLPAAIGRLSDRLFLLFCVETSIGRMDAPEDRQEPTRLRAAETAVAPVSPRQIDTAADIPVAELAEAEPSPASGDVEARFETGDLDAVEIEEGATAEDLDHLAAIDGASPDHIAAAGSDMPAGLMADIAEAAAGDVEAASPEVEPTELSADMAEADAVAVQPPEDYIEPQHLDAGSDKDVAEPSESLDAVQADDAADDVSAVFPVDEAPESRHLDAPAVASAEDQTFQFDHGARPVRFVWKLDANGAFAEVSDEFARTVGPRAGDIAGRSFRDLAAAFDLDPEQQIAGLLDRRDTWSGRTIKWPVEGTDLVVPVDLAALPTYSRNREFDGFRGFGIIRVGDTEADPRGLGLTFVITESAPSPEPDPAAVATAPEAEEAPLDEFRGEVPALDIVSNPLATFSDKIIKLEERRARGVREGLSASEQAALKEIARQLEPFGKRPNEDILKSTSGLLQTEDVEGADAPEDDAAFDLHTVDGGEAEDNDGDMFDAIDETARMDEQSVQSLFEDLGTGPGLTAYAIDQVPMAILIHAGDRLIEANGEFRRLTGYADIAELEQAGGLDALITRREGPDAGVYLVRADHTQVLVSARLQSVRYEGSSALMLALTPAAGTLAAVTTEPQVIPESEPARRLAALKVEVDELHSILETATDGVIVLDTEGRIRSMNRSASALFNFDDSETAGKPFAMLFAHESQKSVQDYLAGLAGHGVASVLNDGREVIGREASGGFIPLFMTMGRLPGSNSYCAVIRDITQWKRSEEELRTAKRAAETANQHKSDFLARVSHEIRTPLNAIIGFSDMIANEHFGPAGHSRYVEYAADIGRSGRHVLDIVNDLLDISKIEAGEMDLDFAAVGINDCISEAVSLVQPQANAQRVIIRTSLSQSVPDVVADLRSIKQIALNILANAIRFTPSGGQIVVSTAYEASGAVTLRIRDTGVGMSRTELEQAMKPFGQVASGTRQRGDGTGLGLPLTKAMTEANRASFAIHSAPNEGTLVEITFPPQRVLAD